MKRIQKASTFPEVAKATGHFGHAIKTARLARRMTLAELAERSNSSIATLSRIEAGDPAVAIGTVFSVLWALNLLEQTKKSVDPDADLTGKALRETQMYKRGQRTSKKQDDYYDF